MGSLLQDLRYAVRNLNGRPGFTAVAILTLSIGIGLNASVFTVVDAALLRALPYAEPERLVHLWQVQDNQDRTRFPFAWQTLRELQAVPGVFASVAGYVTFPVAWTGGPRPRSSRPSSCRPASSTCSGSGRRSAAPSSRART